MDNPLAKFAPFLVGEFPKPFMELLKNVSLTPQLNEDDLKKELWQAYEYGSRHHEGQKRRSGESYFENHCVEVAKILAGWNMDHITIIGGLLHDTIEDTEASFEGIEERFGTDVANLVNGVTKLGGIRFSSRKAKQAGNFMKMLISVAQDLRVIIIKFADRLHNMSTIDHLPRIKQHRIAIETRDVYAPLAHRLGMAKVKWMLDDLILKTLNPGTYKEIDVKLKSSNKQREKYIKTITAALLEELKDYKIDPKIYGRPKSHTSIYGKMIQRGKAFEEIYDILAVRVVVEKIEECYLTLGVLHQKFKPIQERFKDFIATPKSNGYQSIHTTVVGPGGKLIEIQIRTLEMEQTAEIGVAAHWRYKEGAQEAKSVDGHIKWLRELLDILQSEENDPKEFMHLLKIDLFGDEIFVFTPKGDLVQLPSKSSPLDFAYQVHTEVGHNCLGAKVNHKVVPLNTELKNGDTVEVITSNSQSPNYGWLKFAVTSKARNQIKRFLKKKERDESMKIGEEILTKSLRRLKLLKQLDAVKAAYSKFGFGGVEQLVEAVGKGEISVREIMKKLAPEKAPVEEEDTSSFFRFSRKESRSIKLEGISNIMTNFGKCCNPIPGDDMIGFITRGRGITVHRSSCPSLPLLSEESDRLVPVEWEVTRNDLFNVRLKVVGQDRKGLLKDMTETISKLNINMTSVDIKVKEAVATAIFIVQVNNLKQLDRVVRKMAKVKNIDFVERAQH
ncbi:MAG: bifunctional (p)ppGpp synthetase/guanosine-3',5'-bis(diphosphate) 3'-pyrophosphohydrolase [Candidatus Marinimicrobia bacterium]|jgi:GTP pyrophosphokinase|nr:bifunctional (p)ppGpp synthetase/guanosine-3',5'-bis(diphosphate) 3'-pyrophosphohydrolase [Candidatus Neomarinimicrobiota bacterium]MBT3677061.1 bifunctional (p)ppGpp synthetase/guanosine-3',5'-bis(diphosphate) 3'-pyrophosphohydrolase [Candidatus Neomarinimicrobiota bacterium]MBT3762384.1 bifunctional (p)ppGpp synthetase/guanosine-3',5'-bis(diphosphate) 3'-pyrophosphohydrolase [Candidatus Neomarinimicrobiota bacterium]MBT4069470.1 bifunctional (p)ppGpp synthetase/guanosine-3',5'-bis(diphospha